MDSPVIKDVLGAKVAIGDKVVLARTGYRDLLVAEVVKLTPKGIKARYRDVRFDAGSHWAFTETQRSMHQFVKVAA